MKRRHLIRSAACTVVSLGAASARAAALRPLQLGVLPHVSPRVLLANYHPFARHLETTLGRAVEISTAGGFREFHARSVEGSYDVAVTAANLGRVAELDGRLVPVAIMEPRIPGLLVMLKERRVEDVEALRGRTLALANPASLVALKGLSWLRARGLSIGTDFRTAHAANEDSLGQLLSSGEAPLAMMSAGEFRAVPEALRRNLEVFVEFVRVPGFMIMHRPDLPEGGAIRAALAGLIASEDGQAFARLTGTREIRDVQAEDAAFLTDILDETRRLIS